MLAGSFSAKTAKSNKDKPGPDISSTEKKNERKRSQRSHSSAIQYGSKIPPMVYRATP